MFTKLNAITGTIATSSRNQALTTCVNHAVSVSGYPGNAAPQASAAFYAAANHP
jgi:hypothetical protein